MALSKQQWQFNTIRDDKPKYQIHLSDTGEEVVTTAVTVHTISISDTEDPDLVVADPIWKWQQTEAGQWIMDNSNPAPSWHRHLDCNMYGYQYKIRAYLTQKQLTYYKLRFE